MVTAEKRSFYVSINMHETTLFSGITTQHPLDHSMGLLAANFFFYFFFEASNNIFGLSSTVK